MADLCPSLGEWSALIHPLTEGERRVAEALQELDAGWTVYVQPRLGMDMPDFVAVHDEHGVCVIEVKDWKNGQYRRHNGKLQHRTKDGWATCGEHPLMQAHRYQSTIFERHFAFPGDGGTVPPCVRSIVILLNHTDKAARDLLRPPAAKWSGIEVYGDVACLDLEQAVRGQRPATPPPRSMKRLRRSLDDGASARRFELREDRLHGDAAKLAGPPPEKTLRRRARGPAGSGKSLGLAHRAARLASEGKSVLVVCFNITLSHYLRALVTKACLDYDALPSRVQCIHFHGFTSRTASDPMELFDAVLVDEGQDFNLDWWHELERHVKPGGEMLLVVDTTQRIYDVPVWTDEQMTGAGFTGAWTTLSKSYRLPPDVVPILRVFAAEYLDGEVSLPEVLDATTVLPPTARRWRNVRSRGELAETMGTMVIEMLASKAARHPSDIAFLCETHRDGIAVVEYLEARGVTVNHNFATNMAAQWQAKQRFWPDGEGVRGSTVHSFKGWEAPAVVLGIDTNQWSARLAYVAMTRLLVDPHGVDRSAIGVVNANKTLNDFRDTFKYGVGLPPPTPAAQVA